MATFEISYCVDPARSSAAIAVTSRRRPRPAPATTRPGPSPHETARSDRARGCTATRAPGDVDELRHALLPVGHGLLGQPHHQIEADVVESGRRASATACARAIGACRRPRRSELGVAEGLDTETHAIDARTAKIPSSRGSDAVSGFVSSVTSASAVTVERVAARGDQPRDLRWLEQGRRPAAEVDRVGLGGRPPRRAESPSRARPRSAPSTPRRTGPD